MTHCAGQDQGMPLFTQQWEMDQDMPSSSAVREYKRQILQEMTILFIIGAGGFHFAKDKNITTL